MFTINYSPIYTKQKSKELLVSLMFEPLFTQDHIDAYSIKHEIKLNDKGIEME